MDDLNVFIATVALIMSMVSLLLSLRNRREEIKREEEYQIRLRVWDILSGESGSRSVNALHEKDGKTEKRIQLLE